MTGSQLVLWKFLIFNLTIAIFNFQLILREDKVYLYFKNKEFTDRTGLPTNVSELEHIIKTIHGWTCCAGNPRNTKTNIRLEAAYIDGEVWRHKNCSVIMEKGISCMKCISINELVDKRINYNNDLKFRPKMTQRIAKKGR